MFLVPKIDFFISIYECKDGYLRYDQGFECWSALHTFYCALFAFGIILTLIVTVFVSLFYNESRPTHTDALRRLDANNELYLSFYRILLVVVSHYTADYPSFQWLVLALHVVIASHLVKLYS